MTKLNTLKVVLFSFILGVSISGCQNAPNSSSQKEALIDVQKVYVSLEVSGMTCSGCEKTVQSALIALDGVDSAFATHIDKYVKVFVDTTKVSIKQMQDVIDAKGYTAGDLIK